MINDLHNTTRGVAINIGKKIVNAYPDSFTLENLTSDAAGASLGQRIYDRINYVKQDQNNTERSQPCSLQDLDEPVKKPKAQDEYGCVAYMPELPQTENWESQEEKRLKLIEYYKSSKPVEDILELLSETYYLQRKNINREKRDLSQFFIDWPYLTHYKAIIAHANQLLGKNCLEIWKKSLNDEYIPINCCLRNKEIVQAEKLKKKKEDVSDEETIDLVQVPNPKKKIIVNVRSFLDGILITFLLYFIFGYVYPPEIEGTLEVIQRLFLKINPPRGTKRGGKRKAVIQHPKYTAFIEHVNGFKNEEIGDL
ncbi:uncharacterized protein LOC141527621 [Cotesia typhae]|uniref:uncharacterized protein LOC141527621 n=1 Tax=Cotesia typhae TaxID=2053667 RepID=UPI003D69326B